MLLISVCVCVCEVHPLYSVLRSCVIKYQLVMRCKVMMANCVSKATELCFKQVGFREVHGRQQINSLLTYVRQGSLGWLGSMPVHAHYYLLTGNSSLTQIRCL